MDPSISDFDLPVPSQGIERVEVSEGSYGRAAHGGVLRADSADGTYSARVASVGEDGLRTAPTAVFFVGEQVCISMNMYV